MADEETNQILRELLATQKEHLQIMRRIDDRAYGKSTRVEKEYHEHLRRIEQACDKQVESAVQSNAVYREHIGRTTAANFANRVAIVMRALALLGVVAILAYLVFFGVHKH